MEIRGNIYYKEQFHKGIVSIENGIVTDITFVSVDSDDYIIPGLIDTHFHGCAGADFSDGNLDGLKTIARYQRSHGIVGICPATMTLPQSDIVNACKAAADFHRTGTDLNEEYAELLGVYIEGPFISAKKCGAQRTDCVCSPDVTMVDKLMSESGEMVKVVALAPEVEGSAEFIQSVRDRYPGLHISIAHTTADYDIATEAINKGANRLTHYYNAMEHYEDIGKAFSEAKAGYAELICDGVHNDENRIRNAFELFGADRIVLISDSMRATGCGDGIYTLGGQAVNVKGSLAILDNGAKAGSVTNLFDCFMAALDMGIPIIDALKTVTVNPAKSIGVFERYGSIEVGKEAHIDILSKGFGLQGII